MLKANKAFLFIFCLATLASCVDPDYYKIEIPAPTPDVAIPLVKLNATVGELADSASDNTRISIDDEGRVTIFYEGEIIKRQSIEVFPPVPWFDDFPIADTIAPLPLPIDSTFLIEKAIFKESLVFFKFINSGFEDLSIELTMPELTKDGMVFQHNFEMPASGTGDNFFQSEIISLDGYVANTTDNKIFFNYDARTPDGTRVVLDEAYMNIDVLRFSYMEGFFGERVFNLTGSAIPIGIFNNWLSGGFSFDKPELTVSVDNSFGFPVTTFFSRLDFNTLSGDIFEIESDILNEGIVFGYPTTAESGTVKSTSFNITPDNSNIEEIFNEKATQLNYDIEAIANPDGETVIGFFEESSFFTINAAVEVPLHTRIDDLVLTEEFEVEIQDFENINSGELLVAINNGLPLATDLQILFEDETGTFQDLLLNGSWTSINPSDQIGEPAEAQEQQVFIYEIDADNWEQISTTNKVRVNLRLNTTGSDQGEFIWIYDYQGINISISAKIDQQ